MISFVFSAREENPFSGNPLKKLRSLSRGRVLYQGKHGRGQKRYWANACEKPRRERARDNGPLTTPSLEKGN